MCKQIELDEAVQKAAAKRAKEGVVMTDDERRKLVSTEQSLQVEAEPNLPSNIRGLETFTLGNDDEEDNKKEAVFDAESVFGKPAAEPASEDDEDA